MPLLGRESLVDMESQHRVIVCLEADCNCASGVPVGYPGNLLRRAHLSLGLDDQMKPPLVSLFEYSILPLRRILTIFKECP